MSVSITKPSVNAKCHNSENRENISEIYLSMSLKSEIISSGFGIITFEPYNLG